MALIKLLEGVRTPFFDSFFLLVTQLGETMMLIVIATILLWCVDKKWGYLLITIGAWGMSLNLLLKHVFHIARPWVRDPEHTVVEGAKEAATGYSFPSGHTQNGTTLFGGLAWLSGGRVFRGAMLTLAALIAFSRLYLGVHTFWDVLVSLILGAALVLCLPLIQKLDAHPKGKHVLRLSLPVFSLIVLVCVSYLPHADPLMALEGMQNAYMGLGVTCGLVVIQYIDEKKLCYPTDCTWWAQILKLLLGIVLVMCVRQYLKVPIERLCGGHPVAYAIRYAALVITAGTIWPLTFRFWSRLGKKRATQTETR